ncbi:MAG: nickel-responsive transcriptional regulator NikR [Deltaproteobacteria bacterium]|nr:nickel-responsive transcriptional regulator NikR [Deltaproteobacteria bacterium]
MTTKATSQGKAKIPRSSDDHGKVVRVSMALEEDLLARFDALVAQRQYQTRSEALRDLMRASLVDQQWADNREVVGTVTLLYDHHIPDVGPALTHLQHEADAHVLSALHVHLDARLCLEVIVVQGASDDVRALADALISIRGVLHGRLTASSVGAELAAEGYGDDEGNEGPAHPAHGGKRSSHTHRH